MPTSRKGGKMIEMLNCDCMDYMATLPDKAFDLAIVDPPYGIGASGTFGHYWDSTRQCAAVPGVNNIQKEWDNAIPDEKYFYELFRVSKNQIIWGGNYYTRYLPETRSWICYDKKQPELNSFGKFELAWTSLNKIPDIFRYYPTHVTQGKRIHPTQKPVALYKWLLSRYAKPGDRIIDTHGGSGSICIACHDLGFDLTWMELDADYYEAACKRYKDHADQALLFEPQEIRQKTYNNEFDLTQRSSVSQVKQMLG